MLWKRDGVSERLCDCERVRDDECIAGGNRLTDGQCLNYWELHRYAECFFYEQWQQHYFADSHSLGDVKQRRCLFYERVHDDLVAWVVQLVKPDFS